MTNGFRFSEGLPMFKERMRTIPHAADDLKTLAGEKLAWLDDQIDGRQWICGDRFTLADIHLYAFLAFGANVGQPLDSSLRNLPSWFERVGQRPSADA